MKKHSFLQAALLVAALFCAIQMQAQSRIGIVAGANMAKLGITPAEPVSSRTGLMVGLFYDRELGENVAMSIGGIYSQRGANFEGLEVSLNYVEADYRLKAIAGGPDFAAYLMAGPRVGILIEASGYLPGLNRNGDISQLFQEYDLGYSAGVGVRYGPVFVEASYTGSLMNITTEPGLKVLNKGVQLAGGVSIPIGY